MVGSNNKKLFLIFLAILVVTLSIILILFAKNEGDDSMRSIVEENTKHMVTTNGSIIWAYNSTPNEVIDNAKEYIENNGYNHSDIKFVFQNSKETYNPNFPSNRNDTPFVYYVAEGYKNIYVGYFAIDETGKVTAENELRIEEELSKIKTEPDIGGTEAIMAARGYLDLSSDIPAITVERRLYNGTNVDEFLFCYMIKFKGDDKIIYIDGTTGDRIE